MKKVLTFGVFDYLHYGHLKLFERAAKLGDYLIVAVQVDEEIHRTKPDAKVLYTFEQRREFVGEIKYVNEAIPYYQVADDIKNIDFDVFVVGGDQNHSGIMQAIEWSKSHGKEVVRLERTEGISSSAIKNGKIS